MLGMPYRSEELNVCVKTIKSTVYGKERRVIEEETNIISLKSVYVPLSVEYGQYPILAFCEAFLPLPLIS